MALSPTHQDILDLMPSNKPINVEVLADMTDLTENSLAMFSQAAQAAGLISVTVAKTDGGLTFALTKLTKEPIALYTEHHFAMISDVGIAYDSQHVWVCFDGISIFRAKIFQGQLAATFDLSTYKLMSIADPAPTEDPNP